jgi:hypothetical protein
MDTTRICSVDECGRKHCAKGLCNTHYYRWRNYGDALHGGEMPERAPQRRANPEDIESRYGNWTVVDASVRARVICRCDCGTERAVSLYDLMRKDPSQRSTSCGCMRGPRFSEIRKKHGLSLSGDYRYILWKSILTRCYNSNRREWKNYGGRGIMVHLPWHDSTTFMADLINLIGDRPEGTSLDRVNNDGNYEPGNIRWATPKQQSANQRPRQRKV